MVHKLVGIALEVDLKNCIARFHHDVVVRYLKFIEPFDVDGQRSTAALDNASIQLTITRNRC